MMFGFMLVDVWARLNALRDQQPDAAPQPRDASVFADRQSVFRHSVSVGTFGCRCFCGAVARPSRRRACDRCGVIWRFSRIRRLRLGRPIAEVGRQLEALYPRLMFIGVTGSWQEWTDNGLYITDPVMRELYATPDELLRYLSRLLPAC